MIEIPSQTAKTAVKAFLDEQFNKKTEKEQKQLAKAQADGSHARVATLQEKLDTVRDKYQAVEWLDNAANKMAKQLHFGSHISKGVHPDAKGDNIAFQANACLPPDIIGTHSVNSQYIDANGNAAALPLAAFFDFSVDEQTKIRDLILSDNADFIASLSNDEATAQSHHQAFKVALQNNISKPASHERNKQMLWAVNPYAAETIDALDYRAIVPLYPSVLTHEVYQRINALKFSDANKTARDNRFKKTAEQKPYVSLSDLATVQLGGTKPQNVSLLMSKQGGRNYLLPSMPPIVNRSYAFRPSKFADSIFAKGLAYQCRQPIQQFANVIEGNDNNVDIREARKLAIDEILHTLFAIAKDLQTNQPAGWSKDYQLDYNQKLWLDPYRADLYDETDFAHDRQESDWHTAITQQFATWLNTLIKAKFPDIKHDIGDSEHTEWEREIEDMMKQYERAGKGVFL